MPGRSKHPLPEPRFARVVVDVPALGVDAIAGQLFSLGAVGLEERDQSTLLTSTDDASVMLLASFRSESRARAALRALDPSLRPRRDDVVGDSWKHRWKEHFRPFALTASLVVCPPWELVSPGPQRMLVLEPGNAFGTGLHATTALVAASLERHTSELRGASVLDVGCGTGILSLVALALGASHARAIDIDPDAVRVTRANAKRNRMTRRLRADTVRVQDVDGVFPVVVANIEATVLTRMARPLGRRLAPAGLLVLSGILHDQAEAVQWAFRKFQPIGLHRRDEWVALEFRKAP